MPTPDAAPAREDPVQPALGRAWLAGWLLVVLVLATAAASIGAEHAPWIAFGVLLETLLTAGLLAGAYLASAWGLGSLGAPLWRGSGEPGPLRMGTGLLMLLTLSHALGVLGLLHAWVACASLLPGLALAMVRRRPRPRPSTPTSPAWTPWLWAPGVALLIAAAASPPGWLWSSEARGFDALSYHLELPQEWLRAGRITPVEHNVYSYLPGYMESAFTHLGAASFPPAPDPQRPLLAGLLAGTGWRAVSCQYLHAWVALLACWSVSRCVRVACRTAGLGGGAPVVLASSLAGAIVLLTPWTLVTGSLAYNEMGVVLLGAGALIAVMEHDLAPRRRAALVGLLVGGACCIKPTAILLLAPGIGIVWLSLSPKRFWISGTLIIAGAGLLSLLPWLARNAISSGNPVFPHLSGLFGRGHWSTEQHVRYHHGHFAPEGWLERLTLAAWPWGDAARGLSHTQWGGFWLGAFVFGGAALCRCLVRPSGLTPALTSDASSQTKAGAPASQAGPRRVIVALGLALGLGLVAWLAGTHVQSRFLVPLVVFAAPLIGLGIAQGPGARLGGFAGLALTGVQLALATWTFARQSDGDPNGALLDGPHGLSGEAYRSTIQAMPRPEREERLGSLSDLRTINLTLPQNEPIYLLGDSAPFFIRPPRTYTTTWDRSLMAGICASNPGDPDAWTRALRDAGYSYVLVNFAELARLRRAGWLDPDLNPEAISAWARTAAAGRTWPDSGRVLIRLGGVSP